MDRRAFLAAGIAALPVIGRSDPPASAIEGTRTTDIECMVAPDGVQYCTVGIRVFQAQQFAQPQYQSQWCWAAAISMIFTHYGHPVSQFRIVQDAYGGIVNMPGSLAAILGSLNRSWVDDRGVLFSVIANPFTANNLTAISDLRDNHPQIVGALGHAVVLTAMTYRVTPNGPQIIEAIVRDPWPGSPSRRQMTEQEWFNVQFAAQIRVA